MVDKLHDVLAGGRMKVKEITKVTGISEEQVDHIVYKSLDIKKRLLTLEQKRNWVTVSEECLARIQRNPRDLYGFRKRG